jgi:hypothetical protein
MGGGTISASTSRSGHGGRANNGNPEYRARIGIGPPLPPAVIRETAAGPHGIAIATLVARLDRPSGNITGFATVEPSIVGKRLELLLEIAPSRWNAKKCQFHRHFWEVAARPG